MARKLVVCYGEMWNTPRTNTNVFRTYHFLRERLGSGRPRSRRRTARPPAAAAWGTAPRSCSSTIRASAPTGSRASWAAPPASACPTTCGDAYHFLAHNYVPGSEIYIFGFSRGAYTARSLCGFVKTAGLLQRPSMKDVWRAYMDTYATAPRIVAKPRGWTPDRIRSWLVEKAGDAVGRLGDDVTNCPATPA